MGDLRLPARIDDVDLRRHLVPRTEPRLADQREEAVAVVVDEDVRGAQRQLVQRPPHPIVGTRRGEVVAGDRSARLLLDDHRLEHLRRPVHHGPVEGALEDDEAGTFEEHSYQLGLHAAATLRRLEVLTHRIAVDRDVLLHRVGVAVIGGIGDPLDDGPKVFETTVVGSKPGPGRLFGHCDDVGVR